MPDSGSGGAPSAALAALASLRGFANELNTEVATALAALPADPAEAAHRAALLRRRIQTWSAFVRAHVEALDLGEREAAIVGRYLADLVAWADTLGPPPVPAKPDRLPSKEVTAALDMLAGLPAKLNDEARATLEAIDKEYTAKERSPASILAVWRARVETWESLLRSHVEAANLDPAGAAIVERYLERVLAWTGAYKPDLDDVQAVPPQNAPSLTTPASPLPPLQPGWGAGSPFAPQPARGARVAARGPGRFQPPVLKREPNQGALIVPRLAGSWRRPSLWRLAAMTVPFSSPPNRNMAASQYRNTSATMAVASPP
jgi:hypothetical protein